MNISIIGLGLIGGSFGLSLKNRMECKITGIDKKEEHCKLALENNLVDRIEFFDEGIADADVIIIAVPVTVSQKILIEVLSKIKPTATVIDAGSTKSNICNEVRNHENRKNFVAAHPIAGTENNGPLAAFDGLYDYKPMIICEPELSGPESLKTAISLFETLKMTISYQDPEEHDRHMAYVSHLSHLTSFTLGLTVLAMEKDDSTIFNLAGSGFASTVRLAKSSPEMWSPIFMQNSKNIINALNCYINELERFKNLIEQKREQNLKELMQEANLIRKVLDGVKRAE